jgi:hypothetical protein
MFVPHYDSIVDLSEIGTKELVRLLIEARGPQKCAWLRTRLNQALERRTGRRGYGGSKDRVLSNGALRSALNGHA